MGGLRPRTLFYNAPNKKLLTSFNSSTTGTPQALEGLFVINVDPNAGADFLHYDHLDNSIQDGFDTIEDMTKSITNPPDVIVGTYSPGLIIINTDPPANVVAHIQESPGGLTSNRVASLGRNDKRTDRLLYIGTAYDLSGYTEAAGSYHLTLQSTLYNISDPHEPYPRKTIKNLLVFENDKGKTEYWISTGKEVKYRIGTGIWQVTGTLSGVTDQKDIHRLVRTSNGNIHACTVDGVNTYDAANNSWDNKLDGKEVYDLVETTNGQGQTFYYAGTDQGLYRKNMSTSTSNWVRVQRPRLGTYKIYNLELDAANNKLWMSIWGDNPPHLAELNLNSPILVSSLVRYEFNTATSKIEPFN